MIHKEELWAELQVEVIVKVHVMDMAKKEYKDRATTKRKQTQARWQKKIINGEEGRIRQIKS